MARPRSDKPIGIPRSVMKALGLLDLFSEARPWLGLTELADLAQLPKGTAQRMLLALEQSGFLMQNPESRKWGLGYKVVGLYHVFRHETRLFGVATPWMEQLRDAVQETVSLVIEDNGDGITVERVDPVHDLRLQTPLGIREPLHAGAGRKALLAHLPEAARQRILRANALAALTPKTVTSPDVLVEELAAIRKQGYAITEGEHNVGVAAVAAPVFDGSGHAVASLSVAGPSHRFTADRIALALPKLLDTVAGVSRQLGYHGSKAREETIHD